VTTLKSFVEQKYFSKKQNTTQKVPKTEVVCHGLLAGPSELDISKNQLLKTPKIYIFGGFSGNCLRMQKPQTKFTKVYH
jgi:hypothetical protein